MNILIDKTIGALCTDDYKGINNQYVNQGKVVVCLKNTDSVNGKRPIPQEHCGLSVVHMGGGTENIMMEEKMCRQQYAVRRLLPIECERLQSLPDNFTLIDHKSCSDSARYRALGNGMAQNVPNWLLERLVRYAKETEQDGTQVHSEP